MTDMNLSVEQFVNQFIRKSRRERLLYELTTPSKRYEGLSRFCHQSKELIDPAMILMEGEDLERSSGFLSFLHGHDTECLVLSPDYSLDGASVLLSEAVEKAVSCFDAVLILGKGFAVVFGEVMKGGRGKYLLVDKH